MVTLLFDLDGTLVHVEENFVLQRTKKVLKQMGIANVSREKAMRMWFCHYDELLFSSVGITAKEYWKTWVDEYGDNNVDSERILHTKVFEDVKALVDLKIAGARMAIVTGSSLENASAELEMLYEEIGERVFEHIVIANSRCDVLDFKPNPECVFVALKKLGQEKKDAFLIGNGLEDLLCAKNAGIKGVLVERTEFEKKITEPAFKRIRTLDELGEITNEAKR